MLKLREEADLLVSAELQEIHKPMRSFLVASQLFIGLIYVHEQQVKFLFGKLFHFILHGFKNICCHQHSRSNIWNVLFNVAPIASNLFHLKITDLVDLASGCTLPSIFLIENQNESENELDEERNSSNPPYPKKASKRKR